MDLLSYIQLYTYCYILYNRNIELKIIRNDGIVILLVKVIYYADKFNKICIYFYITKIKMKL